MTALARSTKSAAERRRKPAAPVQPIAQPDAAGRVLRQFRIVFNAIKTHFRQVETLSGASGAQVWALHAIHERPGLGVSELARTMDVRQPTASSYVKALARQGLIETLREGPDMRTVQLYVTAEGKKVLRKAPGPFAGVLPQALAALNERTLGQLETGLRDLIAQLPTGARGATTPLGSHSMRSRNAHR